MTDSERESSPEDDLGLGKATEPPPGSQAERELEELREAERPWRQASVYLQLGIVLLFLGWGLVSWLVPFVSQLLRRLAGT